MWRNKKIKSLMDSQDIVDVDEVVPTDNHGESKDSAVDVGTIIMNEALRFLPAKLLCRFKAVCRDWNIHISTQSFANKQWETFRDISGFFFQPREPGFPYPFLSLDPNVYGVPHLSLSNILPERVSILTSSNGLVCCRGMTGFFRNYYICNPITKQWKKLPPPDIFHGPDTACVLILEPNTDINVPPQYTLICGFVTDISAATFKFQRYNSIEECWKDCGVARIWYDALLEYGVHVNGTVYWRIRKTDSRVLAVNVNTGTARMVHANLGGRSGVLGTMNGELCLTNVCGRGLIVNVFDADKEVWIEKYRTDFISHVSGDGSNSVYYIPFQMLYTCESVVLFVTEQYLCLYDMKNKEVRRLGCFGDYHFYNLDGGVTFAYVNSFVAVG